MGDQKQANQNPNSGSGQERQDEFQKNQGERAGQTREEDKPGKGPGSQSGDRDRAANPQGDDAQRNRKPNQNRDR